MKSYYGRPIGIQQRSFERYHPRPPTPIPSLDWRFATPTRNSNRKSRGKRVHIEWNSLYGRHIGFFCGGIESVGYSRGRTPQIFVYPVISGTGKATDFIFCIRTFLGSIGTKAHETRWAGQSPTWGRPAPQFRVQNQFKLSKFLSQ